MFKFSKSPAGFNVVITDCIMSVIVGGAGAIKWIDACESIRGLKKASAIKIEDNETVIIINSVLKSMISSSELEAIILHEEGHIVLDHLNHPEAIALSNQGKCPTMPWMELEADAYASARIGKSVVLTCLKKLINEFLFSKTYLKAVGIFDCLDENMLEFFCNQCNEAMEFRYKALIS